MGVHAGTRTIHAAVALPVCRQSWHVCQVIGGTCQVPRSRCTWIQCATQAARCLLSVVGAHSRKREMSIPRLIGAVVIVVGWAIRMRRLRRQLWLQPHHRRVLHIWPACEDPTISGM